MIKPLFILITGILLGACNQPVKESSSNSGNDSFEYKRNNLKDTTVKFLWRENKYDSTIKDSVQSIVINKNYSVSNPEKAAIGYTATFIGNDCRRIKGEDQLKCKILTALNLGYQCSDKHLDFLRKWFKSDQKAIKKLENCPKIPETATKQTTFNKITLIVKSDTIKVDFEAEGIDLRNKKSWNWSQTNYFKVNGQQLKLLKTEKSGEQRNSFD